MTMVKLQPSEFQRVLPLYRTQAATFPLISAVIQGVQRGQVFSDERESPGSAIIVTHFGFAYFVGADGNESFEAGLTSLLATGAALKPSYVLWYSPPVSWQARLDAAGTDLVRKRERVRFEFRDGRPSWPGGPAQSPAGFELKNLSADLIPKTEKFGVKLDSRFWASAADFVENGLGVCLVKDGELVSLCYAAAIVDGLAEVDVATEPELRGRGLANIVARQFIKECLARNIAPTWDCFTYNNESMRLALKLGFTAACTYPFYSFNVPVKL
jgi:GNAT superfamily N-acetyltransferase